MIRNIYYSGAYKDHLDIYVKNPEKAKSTQGVYLLKKPVSPEILREFFGDLFFRKFKINIKLLEEKELFNLISRNNDKFRREKYSIYT